MTTNTKVQAHMEANEAGYLEALKVAMDGVEPTDYKAMAEAVRGVDEARLTASKAVIAESDKKDAEVAEGQKKAIDAFKANVEDKLGAAWKELAASFRPLTSVKSVTYRIDRNEAGEIGTPVILLGEPKAKAPKASGSGDGTSGKGESMTVSGKELTTAVVYDSASKAKVALLPGKADASMSRAAVTSALKTAGYTVS